LNDLKPHYKGGKKRLADRHIGRLLVIQSMKGEEEKDFKIRSH